MGKVRLSRIWKPHETILADRELNSGLICRITILNFKPVMADFDDCPIHPFFKSCLSGQNSVCRLKWAHVVRI